MRELFILLAGRWWAVRNQARLLIQRHKLKSLVVALAAIGLWWSLFRLFSYGFHTLTRYPDLVDFLMEYLFSLFFFALTLMLIISNAIISYSGLYKTQETTFLIPHPIKPGNFLLYRLWESIMFSSWAFLFLGSPLIIAYGTFRGQDLAFYLISFILFIFFILLPAGIGALLAMLLATVFPRKKRQVIITLSILGIVIGMLVLSSLAELRGVAMPFSVRWMQDLFSKVSFCQNPVLPSYWMTRAILGTAQVKWDDTIFFSLLILSYGLFGILLAYHFARKWYLMSYSRVKSFHRAKKYPTVGWLDRLIPALLFFLPVPSKTIILKDLKTFLRDAVQWSQFLIFFGLLGIYFINIRNLPYIGTSGFWQYLVSNLNLLATALTLATFTTRFVYPQLSLEGRRFWIMGMAPFKRQTIFYAKFLFAFIGSLGVSELLVLISTQMLGIPWYLTLVQLYLMFILCLGLSAIAVGLGAIYPNLREDNPSKIVAGFGGTLTLVLSLGFVLVVVIIQAIPSHFRYVLHLVKGNEFRYYLVVATLVATVIGLVLTIFPVWLGIRSLKRLEV